MTSDKYAKSKKSLLIEIKEIYHKKSCKQNIDILNQYSQGPGLSEERYILRLDWIQTGILIQKQICKQSWPVTLTFDLLTPNSTLFYLEWCAIIRWSLSTLHWFWLELSSGDKFANNLYLWPMSLTSWPKINRGFPWVINDTYMEFEYNKVIPNRCFLINWIWKLYKLMLANMLLLNEAYMF